MWKPWAGFEHRPGGEGRVERELPDRRRIMVPYYVDGPTPHLILKRVDLAHQYGESRSYEVGEIAYLSEGLARLLAKRGVAEPVIVH